MPESIGGNTNLFEIFVSHFGQNLESDLFPIEQFNEMVELETKGRRIFKLRVKRLLGW